MEIKVIGIGCSKCQSLAENVNKAVANSNSDAIVVKVSDPVEIARTGLMSMPGLIIDGEVKASGRIPSVEEIENWVKKN